MQTSHVSTTISVPPSSVKPLTISWGNHAKDGQVSPANGYGYATTRIQDTLTALGHDVQHNNLDADIQFFFDQPHHVKWNKSQYKIMYHPWESTQLLKGWVDIMNQADEVWTPSPVIAEWYKKDGIKVPIYVYEHGVDEVWSQKKREPGDTIKFLHLGGESARKGADRVMNAFRRAFPDRKDVELTMKMVNSGWNIDRIGKVKIINKAMDLDELINLYHEHDIFIYPSFGEGFGLTPLQAMATGMPTITLPAWAPYARFLDPDLSVGSTLRRSPWHNTIHPGKMFRPDFDELVERMRYAADNYSTVHDFAQSQVAGIRVDYDWTTLTKEAFDGLQKRI